MSQYSFHESKTENINTHPTNSAFLANSLEEKRKYIYFRRGPLGSPNYECGRQKIKMRKANFTWKLANKTCTGNREIYEIRRKS